MKRVTIAEEKAIGPKNAEKDPKNQVPRDTEAVTDAENKDMYKEIAI